jgi:hypothetical protein
MKVYSLICLLGAMGLMGCDAPASGAAQPIAVVTTAPAAPAIYNAPISVTRAVALFDAICGASLPRFEGAGPLMGRNGINQSEGDDGLTLFSPTEDVSFQVQEGPGQGRTCSMVFGTTETVQAARTGFSVLGQFVETPLGPGTLYRNSQAVVLIGRNAVQGDTTYLNLRLLSER